jgi:hypothetical protein
MHYVPILRWKKAEQAALAQLYERDSICLTPLVELVPENFIQKDQEGHITKLSVNEVVNRVGGQLFRAWGDRPFFIDPWLLTSNILNQGQSHFLTVLSQNAKTLRLSIIPVTGISRDSAYQSAVHAVIKMHNQGVCLRLKRDDIERTTLAEDIKNLLSNLKISPELVDLVVDFKITGQSVPTFYNLCTLLQDISKWRNFIVGSGAFPEDLSRLKKNDIHRLERSDWVLWRDQSKTKPSISRMPSYCDYTIQHAIYLGREGRSHFSASIRYTAEDCWIIMRGEDVYRLDGPGFKQWPAQATLLCDLPEYCKETFSEGDKYIKQMSLQRKHPGNVVTWLAAGINHHMTFVVHQLASLLGSSTVALP